MKRFNVSILAVVAVLAIGLTAFTKAKPAGKRVIVENCYRSIDAAWTATCAFNLVQLRIGQTCPSNFHVGKGLTAAPLNFQAINECYHQPDFFCCAKLELDDSPCPAAGGQPAQPSFVFTDGSGTPRNGPARISAIFCRPNNQ